MGHTTTEATRPPRSRGRRLARLLVGVVLIVLVLVALGPTIVGPLAKPFVEGAINDQIRGHAALDSLRLSWLGEQRIGLTLDDPGGGRVADVSVRVDRGLLGVAIGSRRLGMVTVGGSATIIRDAEGNTNLQRALEAQFPSTTTTTTTGEPASLPQSLAATIVLDGFEVVYQDAALAAQTDGEIGSVRLGPLGGSADFTVGSPMRLIVQGPIATGSDAGSLAESGAVDLEVVATDLTDAAGTLTLDAIGATIALSFQAPAFEAELHASLANGVLMRTDQSRITLDIAALADIVPRIAEAFAAQPGVTLTQLPTITAELEELRLPIGNDLSDAAGTLRLRTTPIVGSVELPIDDATTTSAFTIEPLDLAFVSSSLAEIVTLSGGTRATIGDASAGELSMDLRVGGLLDDTGAIRVGVPGTIAGGVRIDGFSTPILQPFVAAVSTALPVGFRLDIPADLGPMVDLALEATSHTDGSGAYDIDLTLDAQHAQLDAAVVVDGQRVASRGNGVHAELTRVSPLIDRLTAAHGVRLKGGGRLTLTVGEFDIDLASVNAPGGLDLRGVGAAFEFALADIVGKVQLVHDDTVRDFRLEYFNLGLATDDLDGEVHVTSDATGRLNGKPFAAMKADILLAGLLDAAGAPRRGVLPTLQGEVRVDGLALDTIDAVFGEFYADSGFRLAQDIGPHGDILLMAVSNPGAGAVATDLDLTFRSSAVDITALLTAMPDRVRSRGSITLVDRTAGRTIGKLMGNQGPARFTSSGTARMVVKELDVPIRQGGIRPDQISADLDVAFADFAVNLVLPGPDGTPGQVQRVDIPKFTASAVAHAGEPWRVEATGAFRHAKQPFSLELTSELHGLLLEAPSDSADPMSVLSVRTVRPKMTIALTDLPATLARTIPAGVVKINEKPLDMVLLSRDTLGRTFDVAIETFPNPQVADATRFVVALRGQGAKVDLEGAVAPRRFRLDNAETRIGMTPRVASHLVGLLGADAPALPGLTRPAQLGVALNKPLEVRFSKDGGIDRSRLDGRLDARITLDAALTALTLPPAEDAENTEPMTIPPLQLRDITLTLATPLRVLGETGGEAIATLAGSILTADGSTLMVLGGDARTTLKNTLPTGAMPVSLTLTDIASPWIDALLGKPSLVAGALGEKFTLTIDADPERFRSRVAAKPVISFTIKSPRLTSSEPIAFAVNKQAIYLHKAVQATWIMGPRWANLYFLGAQPGGEHPAFAFTKQTRVELDLRRLALAMNDGAGPFKPGIFVVNMKAAIPDLASKLSDGRDLQLKDVSLWLTRGPTPDQLGFAFEVPWMRLGTQPAVTPDKSKITGRIASFADDKGRLTIDTARLDISGGLSPIPTQVVDAFARQDGLLLDALGPTVDCVIEAEGFSKQGGVLHVKCVTPLTIADIRGRIEDGVFIINPKDSTVTVFEITEALTHRFQKAMPVIATLEKTRGDNPARVIFDSPLHLPLDGNMDRLNGTLTIDIGTARFSTTDFFSTVLDIIQQQTAGEIGRRMPPLTVTMDNGLIRYDTYGLPFGEFVLETQGVLNLGSKPRTIGNGKALPPGQLQVLTFIPAGAFAAEAVPALADLPLPILGNLARLPIRTSGLIASPKNDIAVDLVGQEALNSLTNPGGLLDNILGGGKDD